MQPEYWAGKQAQLRAGVQEDVYPYPEDARFRR
jgi:isocitrate dehydrogenase kinase/phosphatase